ncbi:MAG: acyltransferase family protein [Acidobacteriota bacterium]
MGSAESHRIPTLDGWRGIAILMVLADHIAFAAFGHYPYAWMRIGLHGVTLFFVLSGFLITSKLIAEPINLKKFYVRRFFRLMPAAWTFLAVLVILSLGGIHCTNWREVCGCLFFYRNFQGLIGVAGHFWSLSIEEQFYLVWPSLLLFFGLRRCRTIAALGAITVATYRFAFWSHYRHGLLNTRTEVRADALLIGCLLALYLPEHRDLIERWSRYLVVPASALVLFAIGRFHVLQPLWEVVSLAVLLAFTSLRPETPVSRRLAWKPLVWIGGISYTIYVWQEPFTLFHGLAALFGFGFLLPPFVLASYYWIERPLRRWGRQIADGLPAVSAPGFQTLPEGADTLP